MENSMYEDQKYPSHTYSTRHKTRVLLVYKFLILILTNSIIPISGTQMRHTAHTLIARVIGHKCCAFISV